MNTIEVKGITKEYKGKKAIDKVSFTVNAGHIVGLLGPNGAGKTTTMSVITGIIASDEGEVLFDGKPMTSENELEIKRKIGFLSESNPLYQDMLVSEYLEYVAALRGMDKQEGRKAIARVIKETGIEDKLGQPIEELSKGYRQRVGLAQAILHQPEILILDEPTEGLDPNQRVVIRDLIAKLGSDRTVILSTHVLSEVQATCDRVIILNEGKLISEGTVEQIIQQGQEGQKVTLEVRGENVPMVLGQSENVNVIERHDVNGHEVYTLMAINDSDIRPELFNMAKVNNWILYDLHQESTSLEEIFRNLTTNH